MSRKNNLVAVIEREVRRRLEQYTAVRMRMAADAALMAANDVFQCGPGRANEFVGKFIDYCNWIAEIFVEDSKDDPELVYSKAVLDRRIKAIMGEEHFRPYETRYYYGRTGEENE